MRRNTVADIQSKLDKCVPTNGPLDTPCLIWPFATTDGYGNVGFNGSVKRTHRLAWIFRNGEIPKGMCCCHKCDNRACCNTDHMFIGTVADNNKDMTNKGRRSAARGDKHSSRTSPHTVLKGEKHPACKLTENDVLEIRRMITDGTSTSRELAAKYAVDASTIRHAASGKSWKHLPMSNPIAAAAVREAGR